MGAKIINLTQRGKFNAESFFILTSEIPMRDRLSEHFHHACNSIRQGIHLLKGVVKGE